MCSSRIFHSRFLDLVSCGSDDLTMQKLDLVEGQMYSVSGLTPLNGGPDILHLQARGPTSRWKSLPPSASEKFE